MCAVARQALSDALPDSLPRAGDNGDFASQWRVHAMIFVASARADKEWTMGDVPAAGGPNVPAPRVAVSCPSAVSSAGRARPCAASRHEDDPDDQEHAAGNEKNNAAARVAAEGVKDAACACRSCHYNRDNSRYSPARRCHSSSLSCRSRIQKAANGGRRSTSILSIWLARWNAPGKGSQPLTFPTGSPAPGVQPPAAVPGTGHAAPPGTSTRCWNNRLTACSHDRARSSRGWTSRSARDR